MNNVLVIDDVFDNPNDIVKLAKLQKYYSPENNPSIKNTKINYKGERTLHLSECLNSDEYQELTKKILKKVIKNIARQDVSINLKAQTVCLFHCLTQNDIPDKSWIHNDTTIYSGVIYLNENFVDKFNNHGTKILINNQEIDVPYKYNRLIFYRGDYLHSANFGFGETIDDCRLTLNFFINELTLSFKNPNKLNENSYEYFLP